MCCEQAFMPSRRTQSGAGHLSGCCALTSYTQCAMPAVLYIRSLISPCDADGMHVTRQFRACCRCCCCCCHRVVNEAVARRNSSVSDRWVATCVFSVPFPATNFSTSVQRLLPNHHKNGMNERRASVSIVSVCLFMACSSWAQNCPLSNCRLHSRYSRVSRYR